MLCFGRRENENEGSDALAALSVADDLEGFKWNDDDVDDKASIDDAVNMFEEAFVLTSSSYVRFLNSRGAAVARVFEDDSSELEAIAGFPVD